MLPITKASITEEHNSDVDMSYDSDGDVNQATDDVDEIRTGSAAESDDPGQTHEPLLTVRQYEKKKEKLNKRSFMPTW